MSNRKSRPAPASATAPARKAAAKAPHAGRKVRLPSAKASAATAPKPAPAATAKPVTPQLPAPGPHTIAGMKGTGSAAPVATPPATPAASAAPATASTTAAQLPEPQAVTILLSRISAALAIAPRKDVRTQLNGVYLHQVGNELRIVASDGHRMLVVSQPTEVAGWGEAGVILPAAQLEQVMKFAGKGQEEEETLTVSFGLGHQHATVTHSFGQFKVRPCEGDFPPYQKIFDGIGQTIAGGDREALQAGGLNAKYVKAAGAVSAALGSDGLFFFPGKDEATATLFTFSGCPGALLIIMPSRMDAPALSGQVVRMIGASGMQSSIAALKAHATRNTQAAKAATTDKDRERYEAAAADFQRRIDAIVADLKPALPAPAKAQEGAEKKAA
jgi:hypothetical protein